MKGRLDQLDGLRGVACLIVVAYHLEWTIGMGGPFTVDVFLVLSGFLITGVMLGEWEARGRVSIGRFYQRRILRLYPALVAMLLLLTPFGPHLTTTDSWGNWFIACGAVLTYMTTIVPLAGDLPFTFDIGALGAAWTLSVEEWYYVLWAPILAYAIVRLGNPRRMLVPVLLAAAALLSTFWWMWPIDGLALYYRPWPRFGEMLLGAALALALARLRTVPRRLDWALAIGGVLSLAGFSWMRRTWPSLGDGDGNAVVAMPLAAACSAVLIARLATSNRAIVSRLLRLPPLPYVGNLSYAIYIWHIPVIVLVRTWGGGSALAFAGVIAISVLSYHLVEMPFLRLKDRMRTTGVAGILARSDGGRPAPVESSEAAETAPAKQPA